MKFNYPMLCVLHITNRCNLKCQHCYASAGTKLRNELTFDEIKDIVDQLDDLHAQYIILSGGEPLIHSRFFEIAEYILSKGLKVMITTNGTLINDKIAKRLSKLKVDSVQVSLDSHISERNDEFRGVNGAYSKALNGAKLCKKYGIKVSLMMTLSKFNFQHLSEMIDFCVNTGVDGFALERFVPEGRGKSTSEIELSAKELKRAFEILIKKQKQYSYIRMHTNDPLFQFVDKSLQKPYLKNPFNVCGGCSAGIVTCTVTPDGFVTPCARLFVKIGNLREQSFKEIWQENPFLIKLRRREDLTGKCGRCSFKFICGGCRATPYHAAGNVHAEDPMCWLNEEEIACREYPKKRT